MYTKFTFCKKRFKQSKRDCICVKNGEIVCTQYLLLQLILSPLSNVHMDRNQQCWRLLKKRPLFAWNEFSVKITSAPQTVCLKDRTLGKVESSFKNRPANPFLTLNLSLIIIQGKTTNPVDYHRELNCRQPCINVLSFIFLSPFLCLDLLPFMQLWCNIRKQLGWWPPFS